MHRVLLDVTCAQLGHGGILQDARLLFKTLALQKGIDLNGLVYVWNENNFHISSEEKNSIYDQIMVLDRYMGSPVFYRHKSPFFHIHKLYDQLRLKLNLMHYTQRIDSKAYEDYLWTVFLKKTLEVEDRALLKGRDFLFTDLALRTEINRRAFFRKPRPRLSTKGYDFVIFQECRPVDVSPETKKVIRYHDGIPLFYPHLLDPWAGMAHAKRLRRSAEDSYYVCNSAFSASHALSISPQLEGRITVIPYALPEGNHPIRTPEAVPNILATRILHQHFKDGQMGRMSEIQAKLMSSKEAPEYIFAVATLEPRKNYVSMVRAWERYRKRTGRDLKLVIVASPGWKFEESLEAIRPHALQGNIYHLEKVPIEELRILYSCAKALVFLSFVEGFGFSPVEAMQCDCPAVISDIPAHREVMEDSALYCDPYSIDSICETFERFFDPARYDSLSSELRAKGRERIKLYTNARTGNMWMQTLDAIKSGKRLAV